MKIVSAKKILQGNDRIAQANQRLFAERGILGINLVGSPGGGKTTLLERLLPRLLPATGVAVVEGDLATSMDAERIEAVGVQAVQVNTEGACHLDAGMVASALDSLDLAGVGMLFIENVGNLVCPAGFQLGEHRRLVVLSVAEGDDKVAKYPPLFQRSQGVVLNKTDMLGGVDFDLEKVERDIRRFIPAGPIFQVSARQDEGVEEVARWLLEERRCLYASGSS